MPSSLFVMKLTLNSAVPIDRRGDVELFVTRAVPGAEVSWLPSRFPRLVMLVEPDEEASGRGLGQTSIFEDGDIKSIGDFSAELEDSIQHLLGKLGLC